MRALFRRKPGADLLIVAAAAAVTVALAGAVLAFTWPSPERPPTLRLDRAKVEATTAAGEPYCLRESSVCVTEPSPGHFVVLYARSSQGCTLPWRRDVQQTQFGGAAGRVGVFRDPCHGDTFDENGTWIFGHHAPNNLHRFAATVSDSALIIDVGFFCDGTNRRCE